MRGVHRECMAMTHLTPPMAPRIRAMTSSLMVRAKGKSRGRPPRCRVITSKPPSRSTSSARKSLTQESRGVRDAFRASTQSQKD